MTRVVIVGEIFHADLSVGGGPIYPGAGHPDQGLPGGGYYPDQGLPGRPEYPSQGPVRPGGRPEYPSQGPVRPGRPVDPGYGWGGGEYPGNRPPGTEYPGQGLPEPPPVPTHPWVPPEDGETETLPPPPEDIVNEYVVAVWNPTKQEWRISVSQGATPK